MIWAYLSCSPSHPQAPDTRPTAASSLPRTCCVLSHTSKLRTFRPLCSEGPAHFVTKSCSLFIAQRSTGLLLLSLTMTSWPDAAELPHGAVSPRVVVVGGGEPGCPQIPSVCLSPWLLCELQDVLASALIFRPALV